MSDTTEAAYTFPPPDLEDLAEECAKILIRRGETISVAETVCAAETETEAEAEAEEQK